MSDLNPFSESELQTLKTNANRIAFTKERRQKIGKASRAWWASNPQRKIDFGNLKRGSTPVTKHFHDQWVAYQTANPTACITDKALVYKLGNVWCRTVTDKGYCGSLRKAKWSFYEWYHRAKAFEPYLRGGA